MIGRAFLRSLIGVALAALVAHSSAQQVQMTQMVRVLWTSMEPVAGAKVYNHTTNTLLGVTGADGIAVVTAPNGTTLRIVDPDYGQQQSVYVVYTDSSGSAPDALVFWFMT